MQALEFQTLVADGHIDRVTIHGATGESDWSVFAYGDTLAPETLNQIVLNEQGSPRLWGDLIAAHGFIRKAGYRAVIEVEG